nr:N-acetylgalactosamine-6-sulfatase [Pirellulales bacterium]
FIAAWAEPNPDQPCQQRLPIAAGAIQQQPGTVMDIYPTILNLAGIEPPANHPIDGVDLAPQLAGRTNPRRRDRFLMHFPHDHRSSYFTVFRDGDWKLIYHYRPDRSDADGEGARYELFNLGSDPFEKHDLAAEEPMELRRLAGEMTAALAAEQALFPVDKAGGEIRPVLP